MRLLPSRVTRCGNEGSKWSQHAPKAHSYLDILICWNFCLMCDHAHNMILVPAYIYDTVMYLVFQILVVCRPLEHQRCPNHHHRLYPIHHFCTLQLSPHTVLSHQPDECHHGYKLQIGIKLLIINCK